MLKFRILIIKSSMRPTESTARLISVRDDWQISNLNATGLFPWQEYKWNRSYLLFISGTKLTLQMLSDKRPIFNFSSNDGSVDSEMNITSKYFLVFDI